jgi:multidrug efflux system membrane fusion protein
LTFIDNTVDTTTGMVKLKATFQNRDRRLWPGEFVDVALDLSIRKNALLVPTKAILTGQQGEYVYVVSPQNVAESRQVRIIGTYRESTVIAEGLSAGERVVVNGQLRVAPNSKVVVQGTMPPGQTTSAGPTIQPGAGGSL